MSRPSRQRVRTALWVLLGAVILMVPALIFGRPFIFWDTSTYYGWGHDIVAAIREPWPDLAQFPAHRGMWAMDHTRGAWDRITPVQFQLVFTYIGARSEFYAVPLYLLGSSMTLWAPAVVQAVATSALLWVTTGATLDRRDPRVFVAVVAGLTIATPLPFYATMLMPDIFAGLGLLSAALLLCFAERMSTPERAYAVALIVVAAMVHKSNIAVLAMLLLIAIAAASLLRLSRLKLGTFAVIGGAIVVALGADIASKAILHDIFGQQVRAAPFFEGRVIADGPGRMFLQEACETRRFAACLYQDMNVPVADDIIWPDDSVDGLPLITEPSERHRFLDEQMEVVIGTLKSHPVAQLVASTKNALFGAANFRIANTMGYSLSGLIKRDNDQTRMLLEIVPNLDRCLSSKPEPCYYEPHLRLVQWAHYIVATAAFLGLGLRLIQSLRRPRHERDAERGRLMLFATILMATVLANGAICGATAGPWERYQARVIWLVPMTFALIELHGARIRARPDRSNSAPSTPSLSIG
jgi:hypothetical protein